MQIKVGAELGGLAGCIIMIARGTERMEQERRERTERDGALKQGRDDRSYRLLCPPGSGLRPLCDTDIISRVHIYVLHHWPKC